MSNVIIIPSRLQATRLPNKPLADIGGKPMIQWTYEQAVKADIGCVYVATCCEEIAQVIQGIGGKAILTPASLPSGTDRVYAALKMLDKQYDYIINVQGDLPFIAPSAIEKIRSIFQPDSDITTLCAPITDMNELDRPSVVKPVLSFIHPDLARSLYFSRSKVPFGAKTYYHHIGLYGYTYAALEKFVGLSPSPLEQAESLEQLRALEAGMTIHMGFTDQAPIAVDTPDDLERARACVKNFIQG